MEKNRDKPSALGQKDRPGKPEKSSRVRLEYRPPRCEWTVLLKEYDPHAFRKFCFEYASAF